MSIITIARVIDWATVKLVTMPTILRKLPHTISRPARNKR